MSRPPLPSPTDQAVRLVDLGVHDMLGMRAAEFVSRASELEQPGGPETLLAIDPAMLPPSRLVPLMRLPGSGAPGVVGDGMADLDAFAPVPPIEIPACPLYAVIAPDRGDEFTDDSPNDAVPVIGTSGRSPLLLNEGIAWVLQSPAVLEMGHCFLAAGSRRVTADGRYDARVPAVWITGGPGRDGGGRPAAPQVGWFPAGAGHPGLGIASAARRRGDFAVETGQFAAVIP
ncbi:MULTISPECIES: DUF5701 family protein [unclassified Gordonia (in: high G+C Gram-positive bacteria)]|uniref:DUF5701 family protein n=1 Tax=unclassified Gordonia (in: high G+C Gram-positive bacteria) TaxID=2657482 RepID=UPI001FFF3FC4|nr:MULTISPECIES: DUF5701 family protein [unclassified Gordonia (in: high G+C Gram-positive bacteria)]UQE73957.1 DUF5701 family protein [Gordonia sp. PP30]